MKKATFLIPVLLIISIPLQSCAQAKTCPTNNPKAEKVLMEYLSKEKNIESLRDAYGMAISKNAKDNIISLSGDKYQEECQQLRLHLNWLKNQMHYSIYKIANHYFIVLYSFDQKNKFQMEEIPIVSSEYVALGSIINLGGSK